MKSSAQVADLAEQGRFYRERWQALYERIRAAKEKDPELSERQLQARFNVSSGVVRRALGREVTKARE